MKKILLLVFLTASLISSAQWEWATQGSAWGDQFGSSITVDKLGHCYVRATLSGPGQFGNDVVNAGDVIIKYDATGQVIKAMNLSFSPQGMKSDSAGNLYLAGTYTGNVQTANSTLSSKGSYDIFVVKLNPSGIQLWAKSFGSSAFDNFTGFVVDDAGNSYLTGRFVGDTLDLGNMTLTSNVTPVYYNGKYFTAAIDPLGNTVWAKDGYISSANSVYNPTGLALDKNQNVYVIANGNKSVTGNQYNWEVIKYDPSGTLLSDKIMVQMTPNSYYNPTYSNILVDDYENVYILGDGYRYEYGAILKYDKDMVHKWSFDLGAAWSCCYYSDYDIDRAGNVYLTGATQPKGGYCSSSPNTSFDVFIRKVDALSGQIVFNKTATGPGDELADAITLDKSANCYITGIFNYKNLDGPMHLNQVTMFDDHSISTSGSYVQLFTAKLGTENVVSVPAIAFGATEINIFPNPSTGKFTIKSASQLKNESVTITNVQGQVIYEDYDSAGNSIDLSAQPAGVYFIEVIRNNERKIGKVIKLQ